MNDKVKKKSLRDIEAVEAALQGIPQEALDNFIKAQQRHSYLARLAAHHAVRGPISRVSCSETYLALLSGQDRTVDGKASLPIDALLCGVNEGLSSYGYPLVMVKEPIFVATALSGQPVILTATIHSIPIPSDVGTLFFDRNGRIIEAIRLYEVSIDVMAWKPDASPENDVWFSWMCTIEMAQQGNIGG